MLKTLRLYSLVSPLQLHASRARSAFTKLQHHSQGTVVVDNQNDQHHHFVSCLLNSTSQRDSAADSGPSLLPVRGNCRDRALVITCVRPGGCHIASVSSDLLWAEGSLGVLVRLTGLLDVGKHQIIVVVRRRTGNPMIYSANGGAVDGLRGTEDNLCVKETHDLPNRLVTALVILPERVRILHFWS